MEQENENYVYVKKNQFALSVTFQLIITIALFLSLYFLLSSKIDSKQKIENINDTPAFNENNNEEEKEEKQQYVLKEYNGKLAVYLNNDFQYELDIYVFTLPNEDKKLLSKGICVSSEQELNDVISSYY